MAVVGFDLQRVDCNKFSLFLETIEIIKEVRDPPCRPEIPKDEGETEIAGLVSLMSDCWAENPDRRPSFEEIKKRLSVINKGK